MFAAAGLGAGSYNMSAAGVTGSGLEYSSDYTFTFELRAVNQVPEPAPLALIATAGLAAARAGRAPRRA